MPETTASRYIACVQFTSTGVKVVVKQPATAARTTRAAYNAAHLQCWGHMMLQAPSRFDVAFSGSARSPETEVCIQGELLEELPLLADIASSCACSTDDVEPQPDVTALSKLSEVELPFSVWGLVSLLLLMEGSVAVGDWFGSARPDIDAGLPSETLAVRSSNLYHAYATCACTECVSRASCMVAVHFSSVLKGCRCDSMCEAEQGVRVTFRATQRCATAGYHTSDSP